MTGNSSSDTHFPMGPNNPYRIISGTDSEGIFRLAVNAVDLYTTDASDFGLSHGEFDNAGSSNYDYKTLVPDDVIYPWGNAGKLRSSDISTPRLAYASLPAHARSSYSFVGIEGHKLVGYNAYGRYAIHKPPIDQILDQDLYLHEQNGSSSDNIVVATPYQYVYTQNETQYSSYVGNMLSLTAITRDTNRNDFTYLAEPITLTPIFFANPTVTLEYIESRDTVYTGYRSKVLDAMRGYYTINVSGLSPAWYATNRLYLTSLNLNLLARHYQHYLSPATDYFVDRKIINYIYLQDSDWMIGDTHYYSPSLAQNTHWDYENNRLVISLNDLWAENGTYNDLDRLIFVRGINVGSAGNGYSAYQPGNAWFYVPDTENYKYSCFIRNFGTGNATIGRVFTCNDTFTSGPTFSYTSLGDNTPCEGTYTFNDPSIAGPIMDMAGSDRYSLAYYGGTAAVCQRGAGIYFGNDKNITQLEGTIPSAWELDRRSTQSYSKILSTLVGSDYSDGNYAGIFEFKEYNAVQITNLKADNDEGAAFCLKSEDGESYHSIENTYHVSIKNKKSTEFFENLSHYYNETDQFINEQDKTIPLYYNDVTVVEVPKGYLFLRPRHSTYDSNGEILVYFGDDEYETYTNTVETLNVYFPACRTITGKRQIPCVWNNIREEEAFLHAE